MQGSNGVSASNAGHVNITEAGTDLLVDSVASATGNVTLASPNGSILDDNPVQQPDTRTQQQLLNLWNSLQLLAPDNPNTGLTPNGQAQVAAYDAYQTSQYFLYWQMRNVQPNGKGGY